MVVILLNERERLTQPHDGRLNVYVSPSALKLYVSPVFDNDVLDDDMEAPDEK